MTMPMSVKLKGPDGGNCGKKWIHMSESISLGISMQHQVLFLAQSEMAERLES